MSGFGPLNQAMMHNGDKKSITQVATDLAQARLLLFSHLGNSIPVALFGRPDALDGNLVSRFFASPPNATTFPALFICALSVCGAIFLILELDEPFSLRSDPLRNALPPLEG
jgi:hypothetical protein